LPSFSGDFGQWIHFRDTFDGLVTNNNALTDIQRFHYLLSSLKAEAHSFIQNLPIYESNFKVAWHLVCNRYNNPKMIASRHVKGLLKLPNASKDSALELRHLINQLMSNLHAVEALTLETPIHEILLSHLVLEHVDTNTRREWEVISAGQEIPRLAKLCEFLEARCQALEVVNMKEPSTNNLGKVTSATPDKCNFLKQPRRSTTHIVIEAQCVCCNNAHSVNKCKTFHDFSVKQRWEFAKQHKLCYNCLRPGHNVQQCKSGVCQQWHNTLLHSDNNSASTQQGKGVKNSLEKLDDRRGNYSAVKSNSGSHVLLSTAVVQARDRSGKMVSCRVLLDSGSQTNFVTEDLVQRLGLKRESNHIPISGINNARAITSHKCTG
jgi:hypothetical protein